MQLRRGSINACFINLATLHFLVMLLLCVIIYIKEYDLTHGLPNLCDHDRSLLLECSQYHYKEKHHRYELTSKPVWQVCVYLNKHRPSRQAFAYPVPILIHFWWSGTFSLLNLICQYKCVIAKRPRFGIRLTQLKSFFHHVPYFQQVA